jgi:hypothetical protein
LNLAGNFDPGLVEDVKFLRNIMVPLAKEVVRSQQNRLDVWTQSKVTRVENPEFKRKLIKFYECGARHGRVKCMVLNEGLPSDLVIGAHIYKSSTLGNGLEEFGLKRTDVYSERNGLLLYATIEQAFDNKDVCFLYNSFRKTLFLKLLNPALKKKKVLNSNHVSLASRLSGLMFENIDGWPLQLPENSLPFRRILDWHAKCALRIAEIEQWITDSERVEFQTYFELSEGAIQPEELDLSSFLQSSTRLSDVSPEHPHKRARASSLSNL